MSTRDRPARRGRGLLFTEIKLNKCLLGISCWVCKPAAFSRGLVSVHTEETPTKAATSCMTPSCLLIGQMCLRAGISVRWPRSHLHKRTRVGLQCGKQRRCDRYNLTMCLLDLKGHMKKWDEMQACWCRGTVKCTQISPQCCWCCAATIHAVKHQPMMT